MSPSVEEMANSFWGNFSYNVYFLQALCGVTNFEFMPRRESALYAATSSDATTATVRTRCDTAITPITLANHHWQVEELLFTKRVIDPLPAVTLIDIGANIGLFSRQVLGHSQTVRQCYAYEPEPQNFACLLHNLRPFSNVTNEMVAIGEVAGTLHLHMDLRNCGNNTLVSDDLGGATDKAVTDVAVVAAAIECQRWQSHGDPIFYKSDTQGFDEKIITLLPVSFWDQVVGGVIEIEHMQKPEFDLAIFTAFLDRYEKKVDLRNQDKIISTAEILDYMNAREGSGIDVGFWR